VAVTMMPVLTPMAWAQSAPSALDQIAKRGALRVGWAVYLPYMFRDPKTQEPSGITVDLGQAMAKELKVKVEFVEDSWATMIAGLQAGKFDVTMPLAITEARAQAVSFSDPMTKIHFGRAVRKADVQNYKTWQDLDKPDKRVTTTLGSSAQPLLVKFKQAQVLLVKDAADSIAQVLTDRADAWLNPYDAFKLAQKQQPDLAVVPGPALGYQEIAFAVRQGDVTFRDWVSRFVKQQKQSGNLLTVIQKYGLDQSYVAD